MPVVLVLAYLIQLLIQSHKVIERTHIGRRVLPDGSENTPISSTSIAGRRFTHALLHHLMALLDALSPSGGAVDIDLIGFV